MPTYDDIRSYFDGSEDLQRVVRNVANIPIVRASRSILTPCGATCTTLKTT